MEGVAAQGQDHETVQLLRPARLTYNCYIRTVLRYYRGTWGVTLTQLDSLDSFHRHQLYLLLGIRYTHYLESSQL